jgi:hypothetical protein
MIKEYLQKLKEKKAIREWQRSALGQTLATHTNEYFNKNPRLSQQFPVLTENAPHPLAKGEICGGGFLGRQVVTAI